MKTQPFVIERTYDAPVATVWKALTERDRMKQWYFNLAAFKAEVGFEFRFFGEGSQGDNYLHRCTVTAVEPQKKLAYSWRYDGFEGNSLVTFELFDEGGKTRLRLTHEGLETFPADNPDFAKENFEKGWTEIIGSGLKKYVEVPSSAQVDA